ncbi:BMP family lipoprotein [Chengkuizengella axinellae]|uniref:BMP family ABC transporter substrate-binding protein n=1 Tax=Chengkuizengella axinellae TaxID=3064388 RepID=A0ABT9IXQ0_9BACL|nr:BMP family ABC transporter substrate-binding protein [Chengkuizengella sp. 2205SS18-9]MDP5274126.1 BMP family ABC transporter substrate-binding protein [Chengkuizengella sp. 2205SS18-9]
MKKSFMFKGLILTLVFSLALVGCAQDSEPGEESLENEIKVGMVTDVGGVHDNSFNQSAWEGLQRLEEAGAKVDYIESQGESDFEPNLNEFVNDGWDLTWGIGFLMGDAIAAIAEQNPDSNFGIIDAVVDAPNVVSTVFKEHEGSFLVGVVAAMTTETNKIGFVGGMDIPVIKKFETGFVEGVKAVDPAIEVVIEYTGSFVDAGLGKASAATMYDNGVDVIFHAAGGVGDGVFGEASERSGVWVIGVDKDQSITFGHEVTLTSMMKYVDEAVYQVSKDFGEGNFEGGVRELGLAENGVGLPAENPNLSDEIMDAVNDYKEKIINGEIVVPSGI